MKMNKPTVLITGNAGLIGANLVDWIIENKPEFVVVGIDDLSGGFQDFIHPKCIFYQRDVGSNLDDIFERHDIRIIYHLCAEAAESVASFKRKFYYQSNIVVSANLINYAITHKVDRFVFASSMAVYGHQPSPYHESQPIAPADPYAIGKAAIEMDLKCAKEQHGLRFTIIRPHSVYGIKQNIYDKYRNVLAIWMRQFLNNEPLTIYGNGSQQRAFTFIDDLMLPLWKCATEESTLWETFNLGNDSEMTLLEALETLEEVIGEKVERKYFPAIHEVKNAFSDHQKAREILGLECKTSLKEGLIKMWNWAKSQPKRELQTFDQFELEVGLPEQFKK
jgi:UDP-glucose 4-epimerase